MNGFEELDKFSGLVLIQDPQKLDSPILGSIPRCVPRRGKEGLRGWRGEIRYGCSMV